jgi:hypothetical protein
MLSITFRGGRKAPHSESARPRLKLSQFLTGSYPPAPATVDYLSKVDDWPMYGNDQYGDCVWAMIGHTIEAATTYGQGKTVKVTDADVLKGYSDVTGFNPNDPSTDQGTVIQDALDYWRKTGVGGHRILAFAQVDHTNPDEVDAALYLFGHVQVGINFPASAMTQFDNGQPWDVVKRTSIEGGHAIDMGSKNEVVTWGRRQGFTQAFWKKYVEEAWVAITPEWVSAAGVAPEGLDVAALNKAFQGLTGKPGPFPTVQPPGPTPPPQNDPLSELVAILKTAITSVETWFKTHGF